MSKKVQLKKALFFKNNAHCSKVNLSSNEISKIYSVSNPVACQWKKEFENRKTI